MSFYIYRKTTDRAGMHYERISALKFTGPEGLFARYLRDYRGEDTPFTWILTEDALLRLGGIDTGAEYHCILTDLMPEALLQVCIYRLHSIRGVSQYDESDLALCLNPWFEGSTPGNASDFRRRFTLSCQPGTQQMLEALSLTGGLNAGTYRWSAPKMNLGAAVRPAAEVAKL